MNLELKDNKLIDRSTTRPSQSAPLPYPGGVLKLNRTFIMGILNVTPDSFSDGGQFNDREKAVARARQMLTEGADIIDVGGESTRPGASSVTLKTELDRTIPVIEAIKKETPDALISIDTYKAPVAEAAIKAGARIVNDISGLGFDADLPAVIARHQVPVIIMHIKGTPRNMQTDPHYDNLITEIIDYFQERVNLARQAGIAGNQIVLDPGLGFGKTLTHNYEILNRLKEFQSLGHPLMIGPSRKSFIGKVLDVPPAERLAGTAAAVAAAVWQGIQFVRVHDVKEIRRVITICETIQNPKLTAATERKKDPWI
ncbi:MAG: dihydropteroate synthase [Planctomycetes bacterium]|nr:dihydropteroate synthase [Planctomycetota bacterium]